MVWPLTWTPSMGDSIGTADQVEIGDATSSPRSCSVQRLAVSGEDAVRLAYPRYLRTALARRLAGTHGHLRPAVPVILGYAESAKEVRTAIAISS